jgi:TonB family protein
MLDVHLTRKPATRTARFLTAVALLTVAVAVAAAQTSPVKLSGTVYDSTGAPVPNVAVVLSHSASQAKYEVKSNATGYFEFVPLPADTYALVASLPGFKESKQELVLSGRAMQRDVNLALGSLTETISVRGGPIEVEPDGPRPSRIVTRDLDRSAFQRALKSCAPSSTGGRIRPPSKIKDVKPVYPESLQAAGIGGTVALAATIGTDGTVKSVDVLRSVHPELDASAVEAVKQWQFDGTLVNCTPSEVSMNVSVNFAAK